MTAMQKAIADMERAGREAAADLRAHPSIIFNGPRWRAYRAEQDRQRAAGKSVAEASEMADRFAAEQARDVAIAEAA